MDKSENGRFLPVVEEFYSIQGEGFHTGKAAYFLRVGGCDVGCRWCDEKRSWNAEDWDMVAVDDIAKRVTQYPAKAVVVTGGEPLMWNMDCLCASLKNLEISIFLETSGAYPLSGKWDWICLSAKRNAHPSPEILSKADELKIIIETSRDFDWAEQNAALVDPGCKLWLQPEWRRSKEMMPIIVRYILENPKWNISLQSHKYMRIP
ncbi:MAG: 7-carboxy-7-deazaguanine synthase QueE [Bacteroidales bacterium]|jgi:organic radical activating enzyme|nr:7-carboxy-7-deazaguanine synthase QueE [Bacteroidales bacterium]